MKTFLYISKETFWRIPGNLSPDQLQQMADSIEPQEGVALSASERKKKSNPRYKALKEMARARRQDTKSSKKRRDRKDEVTITEVIDRVMDEGGQVSENDSDGEMATSERISPRSGPKRSRVKRALQSDSSDNERLVIVFLCLDLVRHGVNYCDLWFI